MGVHQPNVTMKLTRRNTLIGLGTVAAGAGVVGGTGAFTTASAERSIEVSTTGDLAGAEIRIEADPLDQYDSLGIANSGGGTGNNNQAITLNFSNLNANTVFTFNNALGITPNADDGPYDITVSSNADGISFVNNGNSLTKTNVGEGDRVGFDMEVDLISTDASNIGDGDDTITINITQS